MLEFYVHNPDDAHRGFMDGCILWWRMNGYGYTTNLFDAGIFTEVDRERGYPPSTCVWVPAEKARAASKTLMLVWKRDLDDL